MPTGGRTEETQDPTQLGKGNSSSRSTAQPTLRLRRGICPCTASLGRPSRPPAALRAGPPPARGKAGVGVVEEALPLVLQSGERENWAWGDQTHRSAYPAVCAPPCPVPPASAFEHWASMAALISRGAGDQSEERTRDEGAERLQDHFQKVCGD